MLRIQRGSDGTVRYSAAMNQLSLRGDFLALRVAPWSSAARKRYIADTVDDQDVLACLRAGTRIGSAVCENEIDDVLRLAGENGLGLMIIGDEAAE